MTRIILGLLEFCVIYELEGVLQREKASIQLFCKGENPRP
jgi:hypothetical protein